MKLPLSSALSAAATAGAASRAPRPGSTPRRRAGAKPLETAMQAVFLLCGLVAVAFVLLITFYLILSGLPAIREVGLIDFLFGHTWDSTNATNPQFGILPLILTSIYGTAGAILIGVPIGFLTAVFLSKVASPRLAAIIRPAVSLLAGIPSVVYGLVGMIVLVPLIRTVFHLPAGDSLLAAIIVLAIMILPSIISVSETALKAVPREYEEASMALGATEIDTDFNVNVITGSDGVILGASGGHNDCAAGAKLTIIVTNLLKGRLCVVRDRVTTITTPGETVDVLVTEYGVAVNPRRTDLLERLRDSGLPLVDIHTLRRIGEHLTGTPAPQEFTDRIIGVVEYRDGTVIDVVRQPK